MLYGKNVVLGVTGSIAAYKACDIASALIKLGASVDVIMTEAAAKFVAPLTFETLTRSAVALDMFAEKKEFDVKHVSLAKKADILVVAPASADAIAKFANGLADDMLSAVFLACKAKKMVCPAMNTGMYDDPATADNIALLIKRGVEIVEPATGRLACGDVGKGKLAEPAAIVEAIENALEPVRDFSGRRVLVTAGGTEEDIDGVRVIANRSSGKMGAAIAEAAAQRGAEVVFIYANMKIDPPKSAAKAFKVRTTAQMYEAVLNEAKQADVIIMAAAPADYRVKNKFDNKIKAETLTLEFEKNPDIAAAVGKIKGDSKLVIFSAETENLIENALGKLKKKNADLVVANDVTIEGAGFGTDTNIASLIGADGKITESGLVEKRRLADMILDAVSELR